MCTCSACQITLSATHTHTHTHSNSHTNSLSLTHTHTHTRTQVGDIVQVSGKLGVVCKITLLATRIDTFSNVRMSIPNKDIFGSIVENFSRNSMRRAEVEIGTAGTHTGLFCRNIGLFMRIYMTLFEYCRATVCGGPKSKSALQVHIQDSFAEI